MIVYYLGLLKDRGSIKNVRMTRNEGGEPILHASHSVMDIVKAKTANNTTYYEDNPSQDHHRTDGPVPKSFSIVRVNHREITFNKTMSPVAKI